MTPAELADQWAAALAGVTPGRKRLVDDRDFATLVRFMDSTSLPLDMQTWRADLLRRCAAAPAVDYTDETVAALRRYDRLEGVTNRWRERYVETVMAQANASLDLTPLHTLCDALFAALAEAKEN